MGAERPKSLMNRVERSGLNGDWEQVRASGAAAKRVERTKD